MMSQSQSRDDFHTTRWSLIRDLNVEHVDSRSQLNELCLRYWVPINNYVLRSGYDADAARDLSKAFFDHLFREGLARADRHGRFREFLQAELDSFLERVRTSDAQATWPPLLTGSRAVAAPVHAATLDNDLQREFALEVISHGMTRLRNEAIEADHLPMFEQLQRYLSSEARPQDIEREAIALGARPLFVTMAIRRLRQRFRHIVDDELARLVSNNAELAAERQAMLDALGRAP